MKPGDILISTGERLAVENFSELQAAVHDQRQTWVDAILTEGGAIRLRTTAIIGFGKESKAESKELRSSTTRRTDGEPHEAVSATVRTATAPATKTTPQRKPRERKRDTTSPRTPTPRRRTQGQAAKPAR